MSIIQTYWVKRNVLLKLISLKLDMMTDANALETEAVRSQV